MYSITVIVPIYKVEKFIEKCVKSLLGQTLDSIQYIFVDDCTPDKSLEILSRILENYPERRKDVIILRNERNSGLAFSRDEGMKKAMGKYIIHCDSDDWLTLDAYEKAYRLAEQENADVVIWGMENVYKGKHEKMYPKKYKSPEALFVASINGTLHNSLCNKLFKRELYTKNNIHWMKGIDFMEDSSVTPRLLFFCKKVAYINECLYFYNQLNQQSYTFKLSKKSCDNIIEVMLILQDFLRCKDVLSKYYIHLACFKLVSKLTILENSDCTQRIKYARIFDECSPYIWRNSILRIDQKVALWLSSKDTPRLINLFWDCYVFVKSLVKYQR